MQVCPCTVAACCLPVSSGHSCARSEERAHTDMPSAQAQGGLVPSWQTTVVPEFAGTTTVVFAGGGGLLLLMQPARRTAAAIMLVITFTLTSGIEYSMDGALWAATRRRGTGRHPDTMSRPVLREFQIRRQRGCELTNVICHTVIWHSDYWIYRISAELVP